MRESNKIIKQKYRKLSKSEKRAMILYILVVISFIIPIIFISIKMLTGFQPENELGYHSNADYSLMIVQCLLGLVVINLPSFLSKKLHIEIPVILYSMYIIFLYCAIFLGEVRSFFYRIPFWDSILHSFSSLMLGAFGFMLFSILNKENIMNVKLSPFFIALFSFCFALTIGAIWELYEYALDGLLNLNMQKYISPDGVIFEGRKALVDTMTDLLIDMVGALISSVVGYFSIKNEKMWFKYQEPLK